MKWQHTGRGDNLRKQNLIKANRAIATSEMSDNLQFGWICSILFYFLFFIWTGPSDLHLVFFAVSFPSAPGIFCQCCLPVAPSACSLSSFSMASGLALALWPETPHRHIAGSVVPVISTFVVSLVTIFVTWASIPWGFRDLCCDGPCGDGVGNCSILLVPASIQNRTWFTDSRILFIMLHGHVAWNSR